jgi:hypothetical protein
MSNEDTMPDEIVAWETTGVKTWRPFHLGHNRMEKYHHNRVLEQYKAVIRELAGALDELLDREWQDDEGDMTLINARKKSRKALQNNAEINK